MSTKFSERIRELREEKGLSQKQLSKELNSQISDAAICFWENEKRQPNLDSLIILAKYFGVSIDYLAGLED